MLLTSRARRRLFLSFLLRRFFLFVYREDTRRMHDRIFAHLFVARKLTEAFSAAAPADAKAKVDKLIREIDKCISLLEEA